MGIQYPAHPRRACHEYGNQFEEVGWTEVPGVAVKPGMLAARVTGASMEPLIPDGSLSLFRPCPAGSREGRIVLVQFASLGAGALIIVADLLPLRGFV